MHALCVFIAVIVFAENPLADDILLNAKDIPPGLKEHGIVEVNRVGDDFKLLLQIRSLNNEMPNKGKDFRHLRFCLLTILMFF